MDMTLILAIVFGALFGFSLNRVGATNPNYIINMLRLHDLHLAKVILFAIGLASLGLFLGIEFGAIDAGNLSIKAAYIGVIIGGALLGGGFAIAGYCPGTGLCAMATGRRDALVFVLGGLLGALAYTLVYAALADTALMHEIAGGKAMLADAGAGAESGAVSMLEGFSLPLLALLHGGAFIILAFVLPKRLL